jgi:hypothetical protein
MDKINTLTEEFDSRKVANTSRPPPPRQVQVQHKNITWRISQRLPGLRIAACFSNHLDVNGLGQSVLYAASYHGMIVT